MGRPLGSWVWQGASYSHRLPYWKAPRARPEHVDGRRDGAFPRHPVIPATKSKREVTQTMGQDAGSDETAGTRGPPRAGMRVGGRRQDGAPGPSRTPARDPAASSRGRLRPLRRSGRGRASDGEGLGPGPCGDRAGPPEGPTALDAGCRDPRGGGHSPGHTPSAGPGVFPPEAWGRSWRGPRGAGEVGSQTPTNDQ